MALRSKWRANDDFLVRHVDGSIIVVEKRAGLLSQSTENKAEPNLHDKLKRFVQGRGSQDVFPVHRLDRVVSGLLVYARRRDAQRALIAQFAAHDVDRFYIAAVHGIVRDDEGTFDSWLVTNHSSLRVFAGPSSAPGTRHAISHWRVVERYPNSDATLVEVKLETGIRNQIRVHFADAGHPLLGELKYQGRGSLQKTNRIFLHAEVLGFVHPYTDRFTRYEADLPPDLARRHAEMRAAEPTPSAPESPS